MSYMRLLLVIFYLFFLANECYSQKIDHTASYRAMGSENYFRLNYDNDYFSSSDKNYTQGYNIEYANRKLIKNPLNVFFYQKGIKKTYGLSIEHIGFTPRSIGSSEVQVGDRPFASAIMLKNFVITTDSISKLRIVSALSLGMIGPVAFGKEMQVAIHKAIDGVIPQGWRYQIQNDLVLNYDLGIEKRLMQYRDRFSLQANANLQLGTLFTNTSVGFNTTFGLINTPYSNSKNKKFRAYIYLQPLVRAVAYDATLQGGIFNDTNQYTISSDEVERLVAQFNYGLVLKIRSIYLEYSRTNITKEFATGSAAKWGGVKIGMILK